MAEVALGERVHAVIVKAGVHGIGHQERVVEGGNPHSMARENLCVVFEVLPDLENGGVLKNRLQDRERFIRCHLAFGKFAGFEEIFPGRCLVDQRKVACLARPDRKRDAHEFGPHLVEAGRLGVDGDMAQGPCIGDPGIQRRGVADPHISIMVEGLGVRRLAFPLRGGGFLRGWHFLPQRLGHPSGNGSELH